MLSTLTYRRGDATNPVGEGHKYILHICNDMGGWGKGFVLAISAQWPNPERMYRLWHNIGVHPCTVTNLPVKFELGNVQFVPVTQDTTVVNMVAQHGYYPKTKGPWIRYDALDECLSKVYVAIAREGTGSVHMPRIGCGLAGGKWELVEPLIEEKLSMRNVPVTVYDYEG